jgi:hypothetical protein
LLLSVGNPRPVGTFALDCFRTNDQAEIFAVETGEAWVDGGVKSQSNDSVMELAGDRACPKEHLLVYGAVN